jgi:hypothetical protein
MPLADDSDYVFSPMNTSTPAVHKHKTLLYAHHGFGKTYQCRHYQRAYGKGFIISGESGLKSIEDVGIDFLPFSSWDGEHDPAKGVFSFRGIMKMMATPAFKAAGYQWVAIDSVTEMSERCLTHFQEVHAGGKDGFAVWQDYERAMMGALKWVRDLPYHVLITSLAVEETDDNGVIQFWPMVKQKKIAKQIPALFDHVFCGIRATEERKTGSGTSLRVQRLLITDEVRGWHGKTRDPRQRLEPVERCSDVTELHARMAMPDAEYERWREDQRPKNEASSKTSTTDTE